MNYPVPQQPQNFPGGNFGSYNPYSQMPNGRYAGPQQNQVAQYSAQPVQMPQQYSYAQAPAPNPQNDIHWVQGSSGAKAYYVEPGKSALLMDSESNKFYIKSADQSGMPLPLRSFRYTEEAEEVESQKSGAPDMSRYLTKDEFKTMLEEYLGPINGGENK